MTRLNASLAVAAAALLAVTPALAADYPHMSSDANFFGNTDDMRSGFSSDFDNSDAYDPLSFELGLRYWYSMGAQNFNIGAGAPALSVTDQSHSVEAYFRVDDNSTKFYAKGLGGVSFLTNGSFSGLDGGDVEAGHIGYAGADLGYSMLGGPKGAPTFGPFAGYMYWNDSPNASNTDSANNFTTATSAGDIGWDHSTGQTSVPGNSTPNSIEVNMLRLGFSGKANLGTLFDISGEIAAVPYAKMSGVLGTTAGSAVYYGLSGPPGTNNIESIQSTPTQLDGWGYGAMAEALVGFHPNDNWTFRLGGRLWYLQGKADATYGRAVIGNPSQVPVSTPANYNTAPSFSNQLYITRDNSWSLFRYGLLAEMSYDF